jgi:hypothetical protein
MIRLELPELPPTSNHAYTNNGFGGRTLSTKGRAFLTTAKAHFARVYPREMMIFKPNRPYLVVIRFFFDAIENAGYGTKKAKTRYKIVDGGNRTKLLEDALKDAGGIDDSQTITSIWTKDQGAPERTVLWIWSLEEESSPFDEPLRRLL